MVLALTPNGCACCGARHGIFDRQHSTAWHRARKLEEQYAARLRKIARHISDIVGAFDPENLHSNLWLSSALRRYSETLDPWARAVGERMVSEVSARDLSAWKEASDKIGKLLARDIHATPVGQVMRQRLAEQVTLIKSIPLDAAERVHELTTRGISEGSRAAEIAVEIMRQGDVSKSKADLIGRTEVARTATALTRARAEYVDSPGYIWRTAHDGRVRPSHKSMDKKFLAWNEPPTLDGMTGHAGEFPNCRCVPIPVFSD